MRSSSFSLQGLGRALPARVGPVLVPVRHCQFIIFCRKRPSEPIFRILPHIFYFGLLDLLFLLPEFLFLPLVALLLFGTLARRPGALKWYLIAHLALFALGSTMAIVNAVRQGAFRATKVIFSCFYDIS